MKKRRQGMVESIRLLVRLPALFTVCLLADTGLCQTILPPLPVNGNEAEIVERGESVYIHEYIITGNTVLPEVVLRNIVTAYSNRDVSFTELSEMRDRLTLAYVERGYVSSGAILKLEQLNNGILPIEIVEGILAKIDINTTGRLRDSFLRSRIVSTPKKGRKSEVVNLNVLEERLQILQQMPQIDSLQSQLVPGKQLGESTLQVTVQEKRPYSGAFEMSNYESPTVGAERIMLVGKHNNVSGYGDRLGLDLRKSKGLTNWHINYAFPVSSDDLELFLDLQKADSEVVEDPFDLLDMKSSLSTYRLGIDYPISHTAFTRLSFFASLEKRHSESFLLGLPFSFNSWEDEGEAKITVLRLGQSWSQRGRQQAFELRSTISVGIDAFDATINHEDTPDGEFISWLVQLQWAQRLDWFDSQLIARTDFQFADSALLGMEKFTLGGHNSVRGYREGAVLGDNGALASIEWHIPVLPGVASSLVLVPFINSGFVRNTKYNEFDESLSSAGLGILWKISRNTQLNIHWAHGFNDLSDVNDLQDDGFQFRLLATF
jgi:hemolysin activation/secretion protein